MNDRNGFRQIIASRDDELTFGKHKGKSIYWILEHAPSYILWLNDEKIVQLPEEIVNEADMYSREEEDLDSWYGGIDPYDFMDD